jgi:hypothetical protein
MLVHSGSIYVSYYSGSFYGYENDLPVEDRVITIGKFNQQTFSQEASYSMSVESAP